MHFRNEKAKGVCTPDTNEHAKGGLRIVQKLNSNVSDRPDFFG